MHVVTRDTLGISLRQYLNASCSQAHRCSGVSSALEIVVNEAIPMAASTSKIASPGTTISATLGALLDYLGSLIAGLMIVFPIN